MVSQPNLEYKGQTLKTLAASKSANYTPFVRGGSLLLIGLALILLGVMVTLITGNSLLIPSILVLGSALLPLCLAIVIWDFSPQEGISLSRLLFFVGAGGAVALCLALLFEAPLVSNMVLSFASLGVLEELAKGLVILILSFNLKGKSVRSGILLGAAVGLGFSFFEGSGYAFAALKDSSFPSALNVVFERGLVVPFTHGLWSAILGGFIFATANTSHLQRALKVSLVFLLVATLHSGWDMIYSISDSVALMVTHTYAISAGATPSLTPQYLAFLASDLGGYILLSGLGIFFLKKLLKNS